MYFEQIINGLIRFEGLFSTDFISGVIESCTYVISVFPFCGLLIDILGLNSIVKRNDRDSLIENIHKR